MHYDVFNGDADGIIALLQLRKAEPKTSTLVTGVKRDIKLLSKISDKADLCGVTILDISMEKNIDALYEVIDREVPVFYCDHHRTGEVPQGDAFTALIDLDGNTCTSLLINKHLGGQFSKWAIVGAYGDNMFAGAEALADSLGLLPEQREYLKELGTLINYNGYGATEDDLHLHPAELFQRLMHYDSPFDLQHDEDSPYHVLKAGYATDYSNVEALEATHDSHSAAVFELPSEKWARRISGVFGNTLANRAPEKAHAVLTLNQGAKDFTVSVRAPLNNRTGADEICAQFPTGGGRKAAAGINQLPISAKQDFIEKLDSYYS